MPVRRGPALLVLLVLGLLVPAERLEAADLPQLTIVSLETDDPPFVAQFNPKEIGIDKSVPWEKHRASEGDSPTLEFTGAEPKTLNVELLFDLFETGGNVHDVFVQKLEQLALVNADKKRPPMVLVVWGGNFPAFTGVIESVSVKYTLFLPDGTPVRATMNVSFKQAAAVRVRGGSAFTPTKCAVDADCLPGQTCQGGVCALP